jgi:hypothetical protein
MNPLDKLATSISEMSEAELLEKLRQVRYDRRSNRTFVKKRKLAESKPSKTDGMDTEGLLKLLELLESQIKGDEDDS